MEPRHRAVLALASMLLLVVLLSGCGLPWPFPQPMPDPKLPDTQQVLHPLVSGANAGDIDSLDPALIQFGFDYGMAQLIFPQLVTLDENQQPVDWVAESHQISADGLTYTFHLRKGMLWSDGTPIDATTFAYSINRTLDPCLESPVAYYLYDLAGAEAFNNGKCPPGAIKSTTTLIGTSIQAPDPLTLHLTLAHPAGYFLSALTYPTSWAVPQALVERFTRPEPYLGTTSSWTGHLTEDGPFGGNVYLLTSWKHPTATEQGSLIFERNERFWGRKPLLRRVDFTLYRDPSAAWQDFVRGQGDSAIPSSLSSSSGNDVNAQMHALSGVVLQQVPSLTLHYLALNWNHAPFDDARVRRAFSLALDRQALVREVYGDTWQPTIHLNPEGMPGYNSALTDAAGRTGKDALTPDLDAARALLVAYAVDKCAGAWTQCPQAVINAPASSLGDRLATVLTRQWTLAFPGYPLVVEAVDSDCDGRCDYSTVTSEWRGDYPDPQNALSLLWSTHGAANYSHASVPEVDALLVQADRMSDQAARIPLYQHAEQLLVNQGATIPFGQPIVSYAVRARVVGWRIAPMLGARIVPPVLAPLSVWQTAYLAR